MWRLGLLDDCTIAPLCSQILVKIDHIYDENIFCCPLQMFLLPTEQTALFDAVSYTRLMSRWTGQQWRAGDLEVDIASIMLTEKYVSSKYMAYTVPLCTPWTTTLDASVLSTKCKYSRLWNNYSSLLCLLNRLFQHVLYPYRLQCINIKHIKLYYNLRLLV